MLTPQEADVALRDAARDGRRGADGDLHLAQAPRGEGGRRPRHRAARRQDDRDGLDRRGDAALARHADGRPRASRWPSGCERTGEIGEPVLEVERALGGGRPRRRRAARRIDLTVCAGEIVAIAGVAGNGQRELAETITGMRPADAGRDPRRPAASCAAAMRARRSAPVSRTFPRTGCTRASRRRSRSRRTSCSSPTAAKHIAIGPLLRLRPIREHAADLIQRYDVRGGGPDLPARRLSGGNLQKVVLAREFSRRAARARRRVADARARRRRRSRPCTATCARRRPTAVGVLLISEDLDEILALADRIVGHVRRSIVGELDAGEATVEEIGLLMAGGEHAVIAHRAPARPSRAG